MEVLIIAGRVHPADIPALRERVQILFEDGGTEVVVCDVGGVETADAVTVDVLANLQLIAKRVGRHLELAHARSDLRELIIQMGLREVLPEHADLGVQRERQVEEREHPGGVEEELDPGDPAI